jgi:hypothetical protein
VDHPRLRLRSGARPPHVSRRRPRRRRTRWGACVRRDGPRQHQLRRAPAGLPRPRPPRRPLRRCVRERVRSSTSPRASCRASCASSGARSGRAACSSRRTHAARTARDGKVAATGCGTIAPAGGLTARPRASRSLVISIGRPDAREGSSRGWPRCGASSSRRGHHGEEDRVLRDGHPFGMRKADWRDSSRA